MAISPGSVENKVTGYGVFDFERPLFSDLWDELHEKLSPSKAVSKWNRYVKAYISDHRPLWIELDIS